jgi:hypothetical protein
MCRRSSAWRPPLATYSRLSGFRPFRLQASGFKSGFTEGGDIHPSQCEREGLNYFQQYHKVVAKLYLLNSIQQCNARSSNIYHSRVTWNTHRRVTVTSQVLSGSEPTETLTQVRQDSLRLRKPLEAPLAIRFLSTLSWHLTPFLKAKLRRTFIINFRRFCVCVYNYDSMDTCPWRSTRAGHKSMYTRLCTCMCTRPRKWLYVNENLYARDQVNDLLTLCTWTYVPVRIYTHENRYMAVMYMNLCSSTRTASSNITTRIPIRLT